MGDSTLFQILALFQLAIASRVAWHARLVPRSYGGRVTLASSLLALAGMFTALWGVSSALYSLGFATLFLCAILRPFAALSLFVASVLMRPWELIEAPSMAIIPKLTAGLAIASWTGHTLLARRPEERKSRGLMWNPPSAVFFAFVAWILISLAMTGNFESGITDYMNSVAVAAVLFLVVANVLDRVEEIALFETVISMAVIAIITTALLKTVTAPGGFDPSQHRLEGSGLTGNSNDLAALIVLVFPLWLRPRLISPLYATIEERRPQRALRALGSLILAAGLVLAQSRGAFFALIAAGAAHAMLRAKDIRKAVIMGLTGFPIAALLAWVISLARSSVDTTESTESRWGYALAGMRMAIHNPIFGVGFGQYPKLFESYASEINYEWGQRTAHSTWILALAETGALGFVLLVALYLLILRRAWRARDRFPELVLSMISYGIAMSFLSHTYTFFPYLLFALVLAGHKVARRSIAWPVSAAMSQPYSPPPALRPLGERSLPRPR